MPSVITLTSVLRLERSVNLTWYPTTWPSSVPSSSAMRSATLRAAIRRGWVWPMTFVSPRPSARQIFGSFVVLPDPVSPATTTTWWSRIASEMSSRRAETGSSGGKWMRTAPPFSPAPAGLAKPIQRLGRGGRLGRGRCVRRRAARTVAPELTGVAPARHRVVATAAARAVAPLPPLATWRTTGSTAVEPHRTATTVVVIADGGQCRPGQATDDHGGQGHGDQGAERPQPVDETLPGWW